MATRDYVPVTGDDWYQRRRDDAEGRFLRHLGDQAGRGGDGTRQGIYCCTADGEVLAFRNAGQAPEVMRESLRRGLAAWGRLPADRRRPGAVAVPGLDRADPQYTRTPPPGGLVVRVVTRRLDREDGKLCHCDGGTGAGAEAARDHLWVAATERAALAPPGVKAGDSYPLPAALTARILRFHLVDNTRGEPLFWEPGDARGTLTLTVESATDAEVRLQLEGSALLRAPTRGKIAERGYDVSLLGYVTVKRGGAVERFDVVAVGDA